MPSQQPLCPECLKLQQNTGINIEQFLQKLTAIKQKYGKYNKILTEKETEYVCLCLSGYTKGQIAFYFYKSRRIPSKDELSKWYDMPQKIENLSSAMSPTVHKYVNEFMGVDRFPGWERVIEFLQNNGYHRSSAQNIQTRKTKQIQVLIEYDHQDESEILQKLQQISQSNTIKITIPPS
ncbi:MAG: hypothetical protein ACKPE3_38360 [Sphaerospermopsis kisseleviana]